jgi:dihydroneopterin aldolase
MRPGGPTRLLVSARDAEEALVALAAGADVIDLKEPREGALGMVANGEIRRAVAAVGGRRPVSATTGDATPDDPAAVLAAATAVAATGVDYVKVGLFPGDGRRALIETLGLGLAAETRLVGVLFADHGFDAGLIAPLADAGFHGLVVDTAGKRGGRLRDHLAPADLAAVVAACRAVGLFCGLAGSVRLEDIAVLAALSPELIGVRGAATVGPDRTAPLDAGRVAALVAALASVARDHAA